MCTSFIVKAKDGSPLYGRTMEWGGFDLNSKLVLEPCGMSFTSALSAERSGMTWKNRFGFMAINVAKLPYAMDGMNETGLTIGVLYLPGTRRWWPVQIVGETNQSPLAPGGQTPQRKQAKAQDFLDNANDGFNG